MFLQFLSKPPLKSIIRSLKGGFLTLKWNLILDFLILKWYFPHNYYAISVLFLLYFRDLENDFRIKNDTKQFQIQENQFQDRVKPRNSAEIMRKVPFQNKEI